MQVLSVEVEAARNDAQPYFEVKVAGKWCSFLVDSGSGVSILPWELYRTHFRHLPLQPAGVRLQTFGGVDLTVAGVLRCLVESRGVSVPAALYVVEGPVPLLGRDLQRLLQVTLVHGSTVCAAAGRHVHRPALERAAAVQHVGGNPRPADALSQLDGPASETSDGPSVTVAAVTAQLPAATERTEA